MKDVALGIDLGGSAIKAAAISRASEILGRREVETPAGSGPAAVMDAMAEAGRAAVQVAGIANDRVCAAGIGAPGPMDWRTGVVFSPPNLRGWKNVPLAEEMRARLGIPCFVDNDANLACFGEFWSGAGKDTEQMCMLTLGTGVGGGIVTHGQLLRGVDGTAAEIGHVKVTRDGRECGCGARGCLEPYGSVTGLVRTARDAIEAGRSTLLTRACGGDPGRLTGRMISEAARDGDALARWALQETGIWLGVGISSLINLLNPERVVLGGGMVAAGEPLLKPLRTTALSLSFDVPANRCEIVLSAHGEDSGVIGAAAAAFARAKDQNTTTKPT